MYGLRQTLLLALLLGMMGGCVESVRYSENSSLGHISIETTQPILDLSNGTVRQEETTQDKFYSPIDGFTDYSYDSYSLARKGWLKYFNGGGSCADLKGDPARYCQNWITELASTAPLTAQEKADYPVAALFLEPPADHIASTDAAVMALLFPENPPVAGQENEPITIEALGDALTKGGKPGPDPGPGPGPGPGPDPGPHPSPVTATITGEMLMNFGQPGIYGFNVNLDTGDISSGSMTGKTSQDTSYALHSGAGEITGKAFSVRDFKGQINDLGIIMTDVDKSTLTGIAGNGFDQIGDIGASGAAEIKRGGVLLGSGVITSGRRVK